MQHAIQAFLLGFPALFSIVNPPSAAFTFLVATSAFTDQERARLIRRVSTYALVVMLAPLWGLIRGVEGVMRPLLSGGG